MLRWQFHITEKCKLHLKLFHEKWKCRWYSRKNDLSTCVPLLTSIFRNRCLDSFVIQINTLISVADPYQTMGVFVAYIIFFIHLIWILLYIVILFFPVKWPWVFWRALTNVWFFLSYCIVSPLSLIYKICLAVGFSGRCEGHSTHTYFMQKSKWVWVIANRLLSPDFLVMTENWR